jgi:hypothetical protein
MTQYFLEPDTVLTLPVRAQYAGLISAGPDWFSTVMVRESSDDELLSNAIGIAMPVAADKSACIEYFGTHGGNSGLEHYINGGLSYLPEDHMQLDVHAGLGPSSRAADLFIDHGVADRF